MRFGGSYIPTASEMLQKTSVGREKNASGRGNAAIRTRQLPQQAEAKKAARIADRLGNMNFRSSLQWLYVLGLPAFGALDHVELDVLAFLEAAESASLDSRVMNEYVFAILTADKAVALRVIEPLNGTLFHCVTYFLRN